MKKLWIGFGLFVIASIAVYGVVAQVSNSSSSQATAVENQGQIGCPFAKQAEASACSASKEGCCVSTTQTACNSCSSECSEAHKNGACKENCSKSCSQSAAADSSCCAKQAKQVNAQTAAVQ